MVEHSRDNPPTTISPICEMASSSDISDDSSLTRLLAWSYIFCWSEGMMVESCGYRNQGAVFDRSF